MSRISNPWEELSLKRTSSTSQNKIFKFVAVCLAVILWQLASMLIGNEILLVSPWEVVCRMGGMLTEDGFFASICFTFSRIALGFLLGLFVGVLLGLFAGRYKWAEILLWPYMVTVKSVPVASFVVIALLWIKSANLSVLISFLMVLPVIYTNVLEGIKSVDGKMLEMAFVFKMTSWRRIRYIWLPTLKPFLVSAVKLALGLAWKSGVAAELIGIPNGSVGEALYYSKLFLNTADMFAWTVFIVLLSVVLERLFIYLLNCFFKGVEK